MTLPTDSSDIADRSQINPHPTADASWWRFDRVLGVLLPFLALVAVSILLQMAGRPYARQAGWNPEKALITVDSAQSNSPGELNVSGTGPANASLEIGVGERVIANGYVFPNGRFESEVSIPLDVSMLWIRVADAGDGANSRVEVPTPPMASNRSGVPSSIDVALFIEDLKLVWIAGRASTYSQLDLKVANPDPPAGRVDVVALTMPIGMFDRLVPVSGNPVEVGFRDASFPPVAIARVQSADLPLARSLELRLQDQSIDFDFRADLPAAHPLVRAVRERFISADDMMDRLFGRLVQGRRDLVTTRQMRVTSGPQTAIITISGSVATTVFNLDSGPGDLSQTVLLTAKDTVSLRFPASRPVWFQGDADPPSEIGYDWAVWRGGGAVLAAEQDPSATPMMARRSRIEFGVGIQPPATTPEDAEKNRPAPKEPERTRTFVRGLEDRAPSYVAWPLWLAKMLIPVGAFLWLLTRAPLAQVPWAPRLAAGAVLLGFLRVFPFVSWITESLGRMFRDPGFTLANLLAFRSDTPWQTYGLPSWNATMIVALVAVAFAPAYFSGLQHAWSGRAIAAPRAPWSRGRRSIWFIRTVLALAILGLLYYAHQSQWLANSRIALVVTGNTLSTDLVTVTTPIADNPLLLVGEPVVRALAFVAVFAILLLVGGLRAGLLGVGLLVMAVRLSVFNPGRLDLGIPHLPDIVAQVQSVPIWATFVLAALLACPVVAWLLSLLLPRSAMTGGRRWMVALFVCALSLALHWIPVTMLLVAGGTMLMYGFSRLLAAMFSEVPSISTALTFTRNHSSIRIGAALLCLLLVWPIMPASGILRFSFVVDLIDQFGDLTVYVLALGLVSACWYATHHQTTVVLSEEWRPVAVYFFAVLALNSAISWMFIPVPLIVGAVIAWAWLLRSDTEMTALAQAAHKHDRVGRQIQDVLDSKRGSEMFRAVEKTLSGKLTAAELTPAQFKEKREKYREFFADDLALNQVSAGLTSRDVAFTFGLRTLRKNVTQALVTGALLAAGPLAIALYQYAQTEVLSPFAVTVIAAFLLQASAQWLLYAFFFGFFYAHIRGSSGLTKGISFFVALVIPFLVYRLLSTQELQELVPFLLWAAQVFLFCSLMGLTFDLQLLRHHGYRPRDLKTVHNVPALSAYASTVVAAAGSAIAALLSNRFADFAKFFIDAIIGGGGGVTGAS